MENLLVCIVLYVAIVAVAHRPKTKTSIPIAVEVAEVTSTAPAIIVPSNLDNLSIRQLKKLASNSKIKRYSNLTKAQLIARLASPEVGAVARKAA
jgi:hypothetical protein